MAGRERPPVTRHLIQQVCRCDDIHLYPLGGGPAVSHRGEGLMYCGYMYHWGFPMVHNANGMCEAKLLECVFVCGGLPACVGTHVLDLFPLSARKSTT